MKRQNFCHMALAAPLNTFTVEKKFIPIIKRLNFSVVQQKLSEQYGVIREDRSAFILGSCIWDLASNYDHYDRESFELLTDNKDDTRFGYYELKDHLKAIRIYIGEVQKLFPHRPIYWKGCTAVHRHKVWGLKGHIHSILYASLVRGRHLDVAQKKLMEELNVPVIDMFDMTYEMAELHRYADVVHYISELQNDWVDYFVPVDKQNSTNNVTFDIIR